MTMLTHSNSQTQRLCGAAPLLSGVGTGSLKADAVAMAGSASATAESTSGGLCALRTGWSDAGKALSRGVTARGVIGPSFVYRLATKPVFVAEPCDERRGPT